jgi:hypothetical protein
MGRPKTAATAGSRGRLGVGFGASLFWAVVDWLGRESTLSQVGITLKPDYPAARGMAVIESVPPSVIAFFVITFGVLWLLYNPLLSAWYHYFPKYPDFDAALWELQEPDPPFAGPDLWAAIVINVANSGAASTITAWKVEALAVNGATLTVNIVWNDNLRLVFNGSKHCVEYLPEHYIMSRTYDKPVVKGAPVTGILPCIFRGVTKTDQVNLLSLKVSFADGTGDGNKEPKWWEATVTSFTTTPQVVPRARPTLPAIKQNFLGA